MFRTKPRSHEEKISIRKWKVPESRLPFVNTEIAETMFSGEGCLVSSVWGGETGGRIYFWNPDTGNSGFRDLPEKIPGAYMLRTGPDGNLYLGCGNGALVRYNPAADNFDILVTGELNGITWGGCVTDKYVVWTASPGETAVFDWRNEKLVKVFRPMDTERPQSLYGHTVIEAPDGRILAGMDVPQARIIMLDPGTMAVESITPPELMGTTTIRAAFFSDSTLAVLDSGCATARQSILLYQYPSFELIDRVSLPPGVVALRICIVAEQLYISDYCNGNLYSLARKNISWQLVKKGWSVEGMTTLGSWKNRSLCGISVDGITRRYDVGSGETAGFDLNAKGPMTCHAFCPVPSKGMIVGAPFINQRFWTIDMVTGEGRDMGRAAPGNGQINQIIWDYRRQTALMSSYTTTAVTSYDPAGPAGWPENPRLIADAHDEGQMRPIDMVFDGRYAWMSTSPQYGTLGGALCRVDPETNEIKVWRNIVPGQKITSLALDNERGVIYCASNINADCNSAPPTQTTGMILAFDTNELKILRLREIVPGAVGTEAFVVLNDGNALVGAQKHVYIWDIRSDELRDLGEKPVTFDRVIKVGDELWTISKGMIGRLKIGENVSFEPVIEKPGAKILKEADGFLYYSMGFEIEALSLKELDKYKD